jgi:HK97 family phage major capsid protein
MTQLFIRALEAAVAGNAEKKALQEKIVSRDLAAFERSTGQRYMIEGEDGKVKPARELLLSEGIETGTLIQTEINRTVLEGSEPVKCFRNAVPVFAMNSNTMQINVGETGTYAPFVSEGAEIPINTQDYTARTWTSKKFGERPMITREMVDDALFSVIELEVKKTGQRIENTLNQWMLQVLIDNAGNEHDINAAAGSVAGVSAMISARQLNAADGFISDTIVTHPAMTNYLYKDFVPGYNVLAQGYTNTGILPNVMGCRVFECGVELTSTSTPTAVSAAGYDWAPPTDTKIGALVFDSKSCGGIGMRQDTRVEQYSDPVRDLIGMSVTMRAACQYGVANAICRVETGGA